MLNQVKSSFLVASVGVALLIIGAVIGLPSSEALAQQPVSVEQSMCATSFASVSSMRETVCLKSLNWADYANTATVANTEQKLPLTDIVQPASINQAASNAETNSVLKTDQPWMGERIQEESLNWADYVDTPTTENTLPKLFPGNGGEGRPY